MFFPSTLNIFFQAYGRKKKTCAKRKMEDEKKSPLHGAKEAF
jgi:hypothetical protein